MYQTCWSQAVTGGALPYWMPAAMQRVGHDEHFIKISEAMTKLTIRQYKLQLDQSSLFFLPYLNGERFSNAPNSRAQFFGLTSGHGLAELHRSILEGVAFSVRLRLDELQGSAGRPERFVASSGGAKSRLWLEIKSSMYNTLYVVPEELECGVVGAAILMARATGKFADLSFSQPSHGTIR